MDQEFSNNKMSVKKKILIGVFAFVFFVLTGLLYFFISRSNFFVEKYTVALPEIVSEEQAVPVFTSEMVDNIPDPRLGEENFAQSIPLYDMDPCFNFDNGGLEKCSKNRYEKEIGDDMQAVIELRNGGTDAMTLSLNFVHSSGAPYAIPEFDLSREGVPEVTYIDPEFILLTFSCFECSEWYYLYEGDGWNRVSSWDEKNALVDRWLPTDKLFFGKQNPPFMVSISDAYIKIQEVGYCCDTIYWDVLNVKRIEYIGRYAFLFDRNTHKLVVSDFVGTHKEDDTSLREDMLSYINWLLETTTISTMDELLTWKKTISFSGQDIPYPDEWVPEIYFENQNDKGIRFTSTDPDVTQVVPLEMSSTLRIDARLITSLDFDTIRFIHILEESMGNYVMSQAINNIDITGWKKNYSGSYALKTDFIFPSPIDNGVYWVVEKSSCVDGCFTIAPWAPSHFLWYLNREDPISVVVRVLPKENVTTTCEGGTCILKDTTANLVMTEYPPTIFNSKEVFTDVGIPYIVAVDSNNTARYYFEMNDGYYFGVTFRGIHELDPTFIQRFLDQLEFNYLD